MNLTDLRHEAHVHHAVRFIEDDVLELFRLDVATGIDLQKPPRCRDDQINAVSDFFDLLFGPHAAIKCHNPQVGVAGKFQCLLVDLDDQFFGGGENQPPRRFTLSVFQSLQQGKQKCCSLARSGLRNPNHILPSPQRRNGLLLDWRGVFIPRVFNGI